MMDDWKYLIKSKSNTFLPNLFLIVFNIGKTQHLWNFCFENKTREFFSTKIFFNNWKKILQKISFVLSLKNRGTFSRQKYFKNDEYFIQYKSWIKRNYKIQTDLMFRIFNYWLRAWNSRISIKMFVLYTINNILVIKPSDLIGGSNEILYKTLQAKYLFKVINSRCVDL